MIPFILLIIITGCSSRKEVSPDYINTDSISAGTIRLSDSLSASIDALDSLKPIVKQTVAQLKYYENLKTEYEYKEAEIIYRPTSDSSAIISLRSKLNDANNEISRLNGELASIRIKRDIQPAKQPSYIQPAIETPDGNSIVITLDGSSRRGNITIPQNLTIYLIPYSKKVKKLMSYDSSCSELWNGEPAKYYNGLYFFNSVDPGKYLVKICTYFGDYKLIDKQTGKQNITMQISPPIQ